MMRTPPPAGTATKQRLKARMGGLSALLSAVQSASDNVKNYKQETGNTAKELQGKTGTAFFHLHREHHLLSHFMTVFLPSLGTVAGRPLLTISCSNFQTQHACEL